MGRRKIRIVMEGTAAHGHLIPFSEFNKAINSLKSILTQTAKDVLAAGGQCDFFISDLSHSSPATVEVSMVTKKQDEADDVHNKLFSQKKQIEHDAKLNGTSGAENKLPANLLKPWSEFVKYDNEFVSLLKLESVDDNTQVIEAAEIEPYIKQISSLSQEFSCYTNAKGRLELISIHKKGKVKIYKLVEQWNDVEGFFDIEDDELREAVFSALGKIVIVSGLGHYSNHDTVLPNKMDIESIEVVSEDHELPSLFEFRGIAPNITGGKSVQEFRDEYRAEWD